jgi:transposase
MRQKSSPPETPSERLVRDIRRATRKQYSAEEKIRIVLDGLRGEVSIAELCRREGIAEQALELRLLKKSMTGDGGDEA